MNCILPTIMDGNIAVTKQRDLICCRFSASLLPRSPPWTPCRRSVASIRASLDFWTDPPKGKTAGFSWGKRMKIVSLLGKIVDLKWGK